VSAHQVVCGAQGGTGQVENYSATGQLQSVVDANGNTQTYNYVSSNPGALLASIKDSSGQTVALTYTGNNLTRITVTALTPGATSKTSTQQTIQVEYAYDSINRLHSVTAELTNNNSSATFDSNTYVTTYQYLGNSNLVTNVSQSDGSSLAVNYIQQGGVYRVWTLTNSLGCAANHLMRTHMMA
jgi:uncharacterized protein RhaS with RHS repeats